MLLALRTSTHIWQCEKLDAIDNILQVAGFELLDLQWNACQLLRNDTDHFTWIGFCNFSRTLANELLKWNVPSPLIVLSDSTIGHNDINKNHQFTGHASKHLQQELSRRGINATVDAISGSGFAAMGDSKQNFRSRILDGKFAAVLVIGGWNDMPYSDATIAQRVRGFKLALASKNILPA